MLRELGMPRTVRVSGDEIIAVNSFTHEENAAKKGIFG